MEIFGLANLALVTRPDIPANIIVEMAPPEANEAIPSRGEHLLVSGIIVCIGDKVRAVRRRRDQLRLPFTVLPEELPSIA